MMSIENPSQPDNSVPKETVAPAPTPSAMLSSASVPPAPLATPAPTVPEQIPTMPTVPTVPAPSASTGTSIAQLGINTDDPQVAVVAAYIDNVTAKSALDLQRAMGNGVNHKNPELIDEAYIREVLKNPEDAASLIKVLKSVVTYHADTAAKEITRVHELAGGEANWKNAAAYFNKSASAQQKAAVQELLNSSNKASVDYAITQVLELAKGAGVVVQHVAPILGGNSGERGITREALAKVVGNPRATDAEIQHARQLRTIGMRNGI